MKSSLRLFIKYAFPITILIGCSSVSSMEMSTKMKHITNDELKAVLSNVNVNNVDGFDMSEFFGADGTYTRYSRVPIYGQFKINGSKICIILEGSEQKCRNLYSDEYGQYYFSDLKSDSSVTEDVPKEKYQVKIIKQIK